jgi:hypothetical protein
VDFLFILDRDFHTIVTEKLSQVSKDAVRSQQNPATMKPAEKKRIKKEILHCINGRAKQMGKSCSMFSVHYKKC